MTASVAIMGHPSRERFIDGLVAQLPTAQVVLDEKGDRWDTGRRALLACGGSSGVDPWHLVVQDDAILCEDFLPGVEQVLDAVAQLSPNGAPVCFYAGAVQAIGSVVAKAIDRTAETGRHLLRAEGPLWGVAIAMPSRMIAPAVADCDTRWRSIANYDMRLTAHFLSRRVLAYYTVPSLVDHRTGPENPSLVPGRSSDASRVAHRFIDGSPLDVNWLAGVHTVELFRHQKEAAMARIAPKTLFGTDASGVRRRIPAGQPIPAGIELEEKLPDEDRQPEEQKKVAARTRAKKAAKKDG